MLQHPRDRDFAPNTGLPAGGALAPLSAPESAARDGVEPSTNCRKDLQQHSANPVSTAEHTTTGVSRPACGDAVEEGSNVTAETGESRGQAPGVTAHPAAIGGMSPVSSTRHRPRYGGRHSLDESQPALEKDRDVLRAIVDLQYLSASQLQRYFGIRAVTSVRRSLHRLVSNGWIDLWEHWTPVGGRTKYALPQRKALAWAFLLAQEEVRGTAAEVVARTLLTMPRRPVRFPNGSTPPFFVHQVRANDVVVALRSVGAVRMLWSTSWDHPLPRTIGTFAPPQPDAIVLIDRDGTPFLLFVEMDRATQKLGDFRAGKSRYAGLGLRPEVLLGAFGTADFRTIVVVQGKTQDATDRRIQELRQVARAGGFAAPLVFASFEHVQRHPVLFLNSLLALSANPAGSAGVTQASLQERSGSV
jgi:hypothetical protein